MSEKPVEVPATTAEGEEKKSKKALNKELKKAQKEEKKNAAKAAKGTTQQTQQQPPLETSGDNFGRAPLVQSQSRTGKKYTDIANIDTPLVGETVLVRSRVQIANSTGSLAFLILRDTISTIQAVLSAGGNGKPMVKFAGAIPKESIVDIVATVTKPQVPVQRCTQKDVELQVTSLFLISEAHQLPLQIEDLARPTSELDAQRKTIDEIAQQLTSLTLTESERAELEKKKSEANKFAEVSQDHRLNNRILDLRVPAHQAVFKIQSGVSMLFREFLYSNQFIEIHSPKMISSASESGASVFKLGYFDTVAYLAQSPQFYKQMSVCADFERVFEIGPVFRAENSFTHRHLTEFTGLDIEMSFREHYHEVLDVLDNMMTYIFEGLEKRFSKEIEAVKVQYGYEPFKFKRPSPRFTFDEAAAMLAEVGEVVVDNDINTSQEKRLGKIIKEKYDVDFYIIDKFYRTARPFYTMPDPNNDKLANAYDLFMRGEEICSGAQRIHDANMLKESAVKHGINIESIQAYIDAFKYGAAPHAGGGVGLERVVMLYLGLHNIRKTSMYPRDPVRLAP